MMEVGIIPPQNIEAERSILGAMLIDPEVILDVAEIIQAEDFYREDHREIFSAMMEMQHYNEPVDLITLEDKLKKRGTIERIGGFTYLGELSSAATISANAVYHANIILEKSQQRKLLKAAHNITSMIQDRAGTKEILSLAESAILSIDSKASGTITDIREATTEALLLLEERCRNKGKIPGLPTGFPDIDYKTGGLQNKDLIIIAGRPSMGKTSLAENIATFVSCIRNEPVAFFSLEMSREKVINRMISGMAMVQNEKFKLGMMEDMDWEKICPAVSIIMESKMVIDDTANLKASDIRSRARKIKHKFGGLSLVVIDHLTEMWIPHKNERMEYTENVREMKRMAKELDCPVILLQQLSRGPEMRADHRPVLSDLRETGASEEVADVVMLVYRDEYYHPDTQKKNIGEVIIAKGRDIGTGTVELAWMGQYTKFSSLEKFKRTG